MCQKRSGKKNDELHERESIELVRLDEVKEKMREIVAQVVQRFGFDDQVETALRYLEKENYGVRKR